MNRRDFLQRFLGAGAAAVALSPLLDLAPVAPAPSVAPAFHSLTFKGITIRFSDYAPQTFWVTSQDVLNRYEELKPFPKYVDDRTPEIIKRLNRRWNFRGHHGYTEEDRAWLRAMRAKRG